jgi:hypothetical protein
MAQSKTIKTAEFDSIVIGGGLSGLIAAHQLESTGRKVALIEGMDSLGGSCRPTRTPAGLIDHSLKLIPETEITEETLRWFESVLGEPLSWEVVEAPPITYDDGKFKPFVGFGDQKVQTAAEVDAYAKTRYLRLSTTPKDWVQKLSETFTGTILTQSHLTKMIVDENFVIELLVNGAKRYSAREVLFCAAPQQLARLLPEGNVPARLRQRLVKGEFWTSVNLTLVHGSVVTESESVHVLKGANEEPSVGLFSQPVTLEDGRQVQASQWLTLVHRDITDDPEATGSALKQIKRQVKRAYETALDGLIQERIAVTPTSHGDLTGALSEDGRWPKLENLWVVSNFLAPEKNVLGTIRQARRTLASIVGEPVVSVESDTDLSEGPQPTA